MNSTLIKLTCIKNSADGIMVSQPLMDALQLRPRQKVNIHLGERQAATKVIPSNRKGKEIMVPDIVRQKLLIPFSGSIYVRANQGELFLGPVVGILTTGIGRGTKQPMTPRAGFFKQLLLAQYGEGAYYFLFSPHDVNWKSKSVNGFFLVRGNNNLQWKRFVIPFPNVIYNRIPNRSSEAAATIRQFKKYVSLYTGARMFNPNFFDKWTIHEKLSKIPQANQHIPETYIAPSIQTVDQMLKKHGVVYLKPVGGSLGMGIIRVTLHSGHGYLCRYHRSGGNVLRRFNNLTSLWRHIFNSNRKLKKYLVQQGISLMKIQGRPVDFRVHLYKNRNNQWLVTAIAAKAAGNGSVTTHVRTGGKVLSSMEALRRGFGGRATEVHREMVQTAIKLAQYIENSIGQDLGELGFDIGVDRQGRIWMFEANSKPGRSIFKHPSLKKANRESIRNILEYSFYLSQF